ncbi:MAG: hypothetical protein ACKOZW_08185, partial [Cyanobium sp.]
AEAMLLDFEGLHTNFSWGRNNIRLERMDEIGAASLRHGFRALDLASQAAGAAAPPPGTPAAEAAIASEPVPAG